MPPQVLDQPHAVFGTNPQIQIRRLAADDFLAPEAGLLEPAIVHFDHPAVGEPRDGHGVQAGVEGLRETLLRGADGLLGLFTFGNVPKIDHDRSHVRIVEQIGRYRFDPNPAAVLVLRPVPGND